MSGKRKEIPAYEQRLERANTLIQIGFYREAVETAGGGVELLMRALYDELIDKLKQDDSSLANYLQARFVECSNRNNPKSKLTFGELIKYYNDNDLFDEIRATSRYKFTHFNRGDTLHAINEVLNKCKHDDHQPTKDEAELICKHLALFLEETGRPPQAKQSSDWIKEWQQKWDDLIKEWLVERDADSQEGVILEPLMDQLMLVTELIRDERVPGELKAQLMQAVVYVIDPDDFIPESHQGVMGLVDDAAVLALTLHWLDDSADIDPKIWQEHWDREDDPIDVAHQLYQGIVENHIDLFSDEAWETISAIAENGPRALQKNWHAEESLTEQTHNIFESIAVEEDAANWHHNWRDRIHDWVESNSNSNIADSVLVVPDLFILVTRLIRDNRVSAAIKARLLAATAYVVSPLDLIPEGVMGVVGLTDDAGALALIGYWLVHIVSIDKEIVREHWPGDNDPIEVIDNLHKRITDNAEAIFGGKTGIWKDLQEKFGKKQDGNKGGILTRIRRRFGKRKN